MEKICLQPTDVKIFGDNVLCGGRIISTDRKIVGVTVFIEETCSKCKNSNLIPIESDPETFRKAFISLGEMEMLHTCQPQESDGEFLIQ